MIPSARILIVGDEVLAAEVADTNGPFLLRILARRGVRAGGLRILPDRVREVAEALRADLAAADLVLVSGGIGPTHDDCTRPAVAEALGRELTVHPEAAARLEGIFGQDAAPAEEAMARLPRGSELLIAPGTAAFGFRVDRVWVLPGVPPLLERLMDANASRLTGSPRVLREVGTRVREGVLAAAFADLARDWPAVDWGSYPILDGSGWSLRLVLRAASAEEADRAEEALRTMLRRLPPAPDRPRSG